MRTLLLTTLIVALAAATPGAAEKVDLDAMRALSDRLQFAFEVGTPGTKSHKFLYADYSQHVHVFKIENGTLVSDWETTNLGSRVTSMFVADLYADGTELLAVSTVAGRIMLYNLKNYDLVWENLQDPFGTVTWMAHANLDDDKQEELILLADKLVYFYDGINKNIQWVSTTEFTARQMVVGNVDDDDQLEVILNTGRIIDSRFFNIQFEADNSFGDRIWLFDINGDGFPEVFGEGLDYSLRVFDVWSEREIW